MKDTLFAIGEALIDFIPSESGCDFSEVSSFAPKIGGAPANVLGAFAKLGGKTQLLTQLGNDPFGEKISSALSKFGIGLDYVTFTDAANTALAFVSLDKSGDRTFSFYRNPSADMLYTGESVSPKDLESCYALHFCSVSLGDFPMKEAHKKIINLAKKSGAIISFDLNLRPPLWKNNADLKKAVHDFLPYADIVKVSNDELMTAAETDDIEKGCRKLLKNAKLVLCTCGADGAHVFTEKCHVFAATQKVTALDTTGAGDAFCGSFLYSLYKNKINIDNLSTLSESTLSEFLFLSNNYCSRSVQKAGAIESYPNCL